jgi:hypothetical protein
MKYHPFYKELENTSMLFADFKAYYCSYNPLGIKKKRMVSTLLITFVFPKKA